MLLRPDSFGDHDALDVAHHGGVDVLVAVFDLGHGGGVEPALVGEGALADEGLEGVGGAVGALVDER